MAITRIQTVYVPADDVAKIARFYEALLGAPRFSDGDRWTQFNVGGTGFAIASREEAAKGVDGAVTVFESDDPGDHDRLVAAGALPLESRDMSSHGRTCTYRDPAGHIFQLFWRA
jgi:predicted enzyme related to lactoylglutathione lyase